MGVRWYQGVTRGQWMALLAALLGWMFDGFEQGMFPLVARPALIDVLHLAGDPNPDALVGLWIGRITAAFLVGAALGGWAFGWLGDRIGRVRAMVFSVLTYAVFAGLCGLAESAWQLAALRFLSALGMGGEWALGVALVMECWAAHARPVLAGLIGAAANVGFVLTGLLAEAISWAGLPVDQGGWRWVLGACALPALLTFFIRMFVPESERWQHAARTAPRPGVTAIFAPGLRGRALLAPLLSGVALLGTWASVASTVPSWVKQFTHDQHTVNLIQITSACGAVLGSFCGAVLGSRVPRRWAYCALCLGSLAICQFLFSAFAAVEAVDWSFRLTIFWTAALTASFYGWLPLYLPELFPTRVRATGQGFGYNFGRLIAAGGTLIAGLLMSEVYHGNYARTGAAISLVYVVGLLVIWLAPETRGQPLPE